MTCVVAEIEQWSRRSFFFQAEECIRYLIVTGVQTCALPISIGCLLVQLFARAGAAVVGADQDAERAALARRFGVEAALPAEAVALARGTSGGRGADHVMITGGAAAVLPWAVEAVRGGGAIHYFAGRARDAPA